MTDEEQSLMAHSLEGMRKVLVAASLVCVAAWVLGTPDWAAILAIVLATVGVYLNHGLMPKRST